ncbi:GNAT family N-acetyltransferase [uncultured Winogradskyella sp.]|uniref:GNAT family N-acetyltransferase n=1 Tax=uncultured Winogradskyella sp. TaxID=395353 RepID=UPI00262E889C|nr:GNAT family N-acetyltransferase [uncultured Winogradskyella sp.]
MLREFRKEDVNSLFQLDSNPIVHKYLGNKPVKDISESERYIEDCLPKYISHGICRLAVIEKQSEAFIGWSGLRFIDDYTFNSKTNFYDVGYRLMPEYWGKGYATEAGKASVDFGFKALNLKTIYGITELGNIASHKALLKIGLNYIEDFKYKNEEILRWYRIKNPRL